LAQCLQQAHACSPHAPDLAWSILARGLQCFSRDFVAALQHCAKLFAATELCSPYEYVAASLAYPGIDEAREALERVPRNRGAASALAAKAALDAARGLCAMVEGVHLQPESGVGAIPIISTTFRRARSDG